MHELPSRCQLCYLAPLQYRPLQWQSLPTTSAISLPLDLTLSCRRTSPESELSDAGSLSPSDAPAIHRPLPWPLTRISMPKPSGRTWPGVRIITGEDLVTRKRLSSLWIASILPVRLLDYSIVFFFYFKFSGWASVRFGEKGKRGIRWLIFFKFNRIELQFWAKMHLI